MKNQVYENLYLKGYSRHLQPEKYLYGLMQNICILNDSTMKASDRVEQFIKVSVGTVWHGQTENELPRIYSQKETIRMIRGIELLMYKNLLEAGRDGEMVCQNPMMLAVYLLKEWFELVDTTDFSLIQPAA